MLADVDEARDVLARVLEEAQQLSYEELVDRAPLFKRRTRLLWFTLSETFTPVEGGYRVEERQGASGRSYTVTTDVFWSDYERRVIRVMVCVDDGGESMGRPLCESIEVDPPA